MRKGFNFYRSYYDVANELNDKDRLSFYDALLKRQFTGVETELKGMAKFAYISQKHSIDLQIKGYIDKTKDPSVDPSVGGRQGGSVHPSVQEKEKEKEKVEHTISFKEPSFDEVNKYCVERNNGIDANKFINFYQSKGWMVGKNKMKDWKAAVRNWEKPKNKESELAPELQHLLNHVAKYGNQ